MRERVFKSFDGKDIFYREWGGENPNPKGLIQIVHGMAESTDRYNDFAEFMVKNGYIVFGDDHRGHGKTDNVSGYASGDMFRLTLSDVSILGNLYKKLYPNLPLIVLGHSYGSFLAQAYLEKYPNQADGVILGGSAMMKGALISAGLIISKFNCALGRKKAPAKLLANMSFGSYNKKFSEGSFISSVVEECKKYDEAWDCGFTLSYNFYRYFFKGLSSLYKESEYSNINKKTPLLLISGMDDPVGEMGKSVDDLYNFYTQTVGVEKVEKVLFEGVRHEYFNDTSKGEAFEKILSYCESVKK